MASLIRPTEATYVIHDKVTVETSDHEDHTFCGVMFPVKCKDNLPLDHLIIKSIAVRGRLGPLTVWVSNEDDNNNAAGNNNTNPRRQFRMHPRFWTKVYEKTHAPSFHKFQDLDLSASPIRLLPGHVKAIYIHSTLPGDEAIVYDNRHHRRTYDDALVSILTGRAHVSEQPFGTRPIWGWGNPWRDQREFVGRIEYGAVYRLWNPNTALEFGSKFQHMARILFQCQRRYESVMSMLPDDCIFYILNMCRWDWVNDTPDGMKELKRTRMARRQAAASAAASAAEARARAVVATAAASLNVEQQQQAAASSSSCCNRRCPESSQQSNDEDEDDDDSDYQDAQSEEEANGEEDEDEEVIDVDVEVEIVHGDDDDEEEEEEDVEDWEDDDGYNANSMVFRYQDDSDEEDDPQDHQRNRQAWIRRQFARIHVLQALAALEDDGVVEMNH